MHAKCALMACKLSHIWVLCATLHIVLHPKGRRKARKKLKSKPERI